MRSVHNVCRGFGILCKPSNKKYTGEFLEDICGTANRNQSLALTRGTWG